MCSQKRRFWGKLLVSLANSGAPGLILSMKRRWALCSVYLRGRNLCSLGGVDEQRIKVLLKKRKDSRQPCKHEYMYTEMLII